MGRRELLMAVDKLVDSKQLDADLTSVADAIREKGGTSERLAFPSGFVSAIGNISGGGKIVTGEVQTTSRNTYLHIPCENANSYRYLAVWLYPMAMQKPGYKAFFCAIVDFAEKRKWFGYTNNAGTADVGNLYASGTAVQGSYVVNQPTYFQLNGSGETTGSVFGYFMPGTYRWTAWGDINE